MKSIRYAWCATLLATACLSGASLASGLPDSAVVYIQVGYSKNGQFVPVEDGTGFLINSTGWVATAKHLSEAAVPDGEKREFRGAAGSRYAPPADLFVAPGPVVSADVALLRFSPMLRQDWPYIKILGNHQFALKEPIVAYGYPSLPAPQEQSALSGTVTGLLGPSSSVQVNALFAPGMSGGPVILDNSLCVVGIVTGGSGTPGFDYFTPIQYARTLLEVAPAEFVSIAPAPAADQSNSVKTFDKTYRVDETRDVHEAFSNSSQTFDVPLKADDRATIVSARLVEESATAASDKRITISEDRKSATFHFRLESGPSFDRWRGWWHGQVVLTQQTAPPPAVTAAAPKCG